MSKIKSLILGSAAGLVAVAGAQAADLPVKAKAVQYVKICSLYGPGFYYIPGTDTCLKIGGYLRADLTINGGIYDLPYWNGESAYTSRFTNLYNVRSRNALTIDTRTATEYGVVRTFAQADLQFSTYGGSGNSIAVASTLNPGAVVGQVNNDTVGNGYVAVENAFVQFAGFTFGKSASAYVTPWQGYPGNNSSFLVGGYDTVTGINNINYTFQFGNGWSAQVGVDDSSESAFNRTQLINAIAGTGISFGGGPTSNITGVGSDYSGARVPDFVGNVKYDQAWGVFQVMGAVHDVSAAYNGSNNSSLLATTALAPATGLSGLDTTGHPKDAFGYAVGGAIQLKNLPTGPGDDIKFEGNFTRGALKYVFGTSSAAPSALDIYGTGAPGTYRSLALGVNADGIFSGGGSNGNVATATQLTRGWGIRGAYTHNWSPQWSTSVFGGLVNVSYNQTAINLYCNSYRAQTNGGVAITGNFTCNPGYTFSQVGLVTRWTPVKDLTFSAEGMYSQLHTLFSGTVNTIPNAALSLPQANYNFKDNGTASFNLRAQRTF